MCLVLKSKVSCCSTGELPFEYGAVSPYFPIIYLAKKKENDKRNSKHVSKIPKHAFRPLSKSKEAMDKISAVSIDRLIDPVCLFRETLLHT